MDKYDEAVRYLTEHPDEIVGAWSNPSRHHKGGCLFNYAGTYGQCGCLTQVRSGRCDAANNELSNAIRSDERIPFSVGDITVKSLPVFAEWQRKIDAMGVR